jgi:flagellar motor protein MotB
MAPDISLLLADVFPGIDSFNLTKWAKDTLSAMTNELRRTKGQIVVSVYTDDKDAALFTKAKYYDAWALSAAKAAVVTRFLQGLGIPPERMVLQAFGIPRENQATLPDLRPLSTRRLEITVRAGQ